MRFDVLTLFPEMVRGPLDASILKRAVERNVLSIEVLDLRAFTHDRHHTADDTPFGGGAGMVLKPEPIFEATELVCRQARENGLSEASDVILLAAQGRRFTQSVAAELARRQHVVLICGHYEGVDARVAEQLASDTLSIGDYVLTGGELGALVVIDAVARLIPGVLGSAESLAEESMSSGLLEYPHFTRPAEFRGWPVPAVLLSGDHGAIARWRRAEAIRQTFRARPDLLAGAPLSQADAATLAELVELSPPAPGSSQT